MTEKRTKTATRKPPATRPRRKGSANRKAAEMEFVEPRPPSPLRGFLPTPPEVEEWINQSLKDRPVTDEAKQYYLERAKLDYYFDGHYVAYRETERGLEVLAVGSDEIRPLRRKRMSQAEREKIIVGCFGPW